MVEKILKKNRKIEKKPHNKPKKVNRNRRGIHENKVTPNEGRSITNDPCNTSTIQTERGTPQTDKKVNELNAAVERCCLRKTNGENREQHLFWSTQPVPQVNETVTVNKAIEANKNMGEIRTKPYSLPPGFVWSNLNLDEPLVLTELYNFLNINFVEDVDCSFRFDYSRNFLKWSLRPPGWKPEWNCGLRAQKSGRLVAFISAIPVTVKVYDTTKKMVGINFLCVHKKLRSKRVSPVLMHEITRRVQLGGIFQGIYTLGQIPPKPVGTTQYWHRSLNPKKLLDVNFCDLLRNMTVQRMVKLYNLPTQYKTKGFRKMVAADIPQAYKLLQDYLEKFDLAPVFTVEEFRHWFLPQTGVVDSFVVANKGRITDFVSYYTLPSMVMNHMVHNSVKAAYSFYSVSTRTPLIELMQDVLISAKQLDFDVFNALDIMDNKCFLEPLKFLPGDAELQFYLYNWQCPTLPQSKIGYSLP